MVVKILCYLNVCPGFFVRAIAGVSLLVVNLTFLFGAGYHPEAPL